MQKIMKNSTSVTFRNLWPKEKITGKKCEDAQITVLECMFFKKVIFHTSRILHGQLTLF